MKINKLYRREYKAARRHFGWVDGHPYLSNAILALEAAILAYIVFMKV